MDTSRRDYKTNNEAASVNNIIQNDNAIVIESTDEKRKTIIFSKGEEINESVIVETKENSKKTEIIPKVLTTNENNMELENVAIISDYNHHQVPQSSISSTSSEFHKKHCVLHINDGQFKEVSLVEIQKVEDKIIYGIKNKNKRMTILSNDQMDIDDEQQYKIENNPQNYEENRNDAFLNQDIDENSLKNNKLLGNYDNEKNLMNTNENQQNTLSSILNNELQSKNNRHTIHLHEDIDLENTLFHNEKKIENSTNTKEEKMQFNQQKSNIFRENDDDIELDLSLDNVQNDPIDFQDTNRNIGSQKLEYQNNELQEKKEIKSQIENDENDLGMEFSSFNENCLFNGSFNHHIKTPTPNTILQNTQKENDRHSVCLNNENDYETFNDNYLYSNNENIQKKNNFTNDNVELLRNLNIIENHNRDTINFRENIEIESLPCDLVSHHNNEISQKIVNTPLHRKRQVAEIKPMFSGSTNRSSSSSRRTINLNEDIEIEEPIDNEKIQNIENSDKISNIEIKSNDIERSESKSLLHRRKILFFPDKNDEISSVIKKIDKNKRQTNYELKTMKLDDYSSVQINQNENLYEQQKSNYNNDNNSTMNSLLKPKRRETNYTIQDIDLEDDEKSFNHELKFEKINHDNDDNEIKRHSVRKTLFFNDTCNTEHQSNDNSMKILDETRLSFNKENQENSIKNQIPQNSQQILSSVLLENNENVDEINDKEIIVECILTTTVEMEIDDDEQEEEKEATENLKNKLQNSNDEILEKKENNRKTMIFSKQSELDLTCNPSNDQILPKRSLALERKENTISTHDEIVTETLMNHSINKSIYDNFNKSEYLNGGHSICKEMENYENILYTENQDIIKVNKNCDMIDECYPEIKNENEMQIETTLNDKSHEKMKNISLVNSQNISILNKEKTLLVSPIIINNVENQNEKIDLIIPSSNRKRNRTIFLQSPQIDNNMMISNESPIPYQPNKKEKNSESNSTIKNKNRQSRLPISIIRLNSHKKDTKSNLDETKSRRTIIFSSNTNGGGQEMNETLLENDGISLLSIKNKTNIVENINISNLQPLEQMMEINNDEKNISIVQSLTMKEDQIAEKNSRKTIHFHENNDNLDIEISLQTNNTNNNNNDLNNDEEIIQNTYKSHCKRSLLYNESKTSHLNHSTIADVGTITKNLESQSLPNKNLIDKKSFNVNDSNTKLPESSSLFLMNTENSYGNIPIQKCRNINNSLILNNFQKERFNEINLSGFQPITNVDDNNKITNNNTTEIQKNHIQENLIIEDSFKKQLNDSLCNYELKNSTTHCLQVDISPLSSSSTEALCNLNFNNNIYDSSQLSTSSTKSESKNIIITKNQNDNKKSEINHVIENIDKNLTTGFGNNVFDNIDNETNNSENDIEKTRISLIDSILTDESSLKVQHNNNNSNTNILDYKNDQILSKSNNTKLESIKKYDITTEKTTTNQSPSISMLCKKCKKCLRTLNDTTLTDFTIEREPEKYELNFSGYEKFKGMPTLKQVMEEHSKRWKLLDELEKKQINIEEQQTFYGPDAPSFEFLLENLSKE